MDKGRKTKAGKKVKNFATSSFWVVDRSKITKGLGKLCRPRKIEWVRKKHCDRFHGLAFGMEDFNAFFWRKKQTVSFSGKGAGAAKQWIITEIDLEPDRSRTLNNKLGYDMVVYRSNSNYTTETSSMRLPSRKVGTCPLNL